MKTVIVDPNWVDEHGRIVTKGPYINRSAGETVRMLEIESGEYWYGVVELIDILRAGYTKVHIRPLHQASYGGWIDYEPHT